MFSPKALGIKQFKQSFKRVQDLADINEVTIESLKFAIASKDHDIERINKSRKLGQSMDDQ